MRIRYFTHSLLSCWNHGNAHFVRGVLRELAALGHDVVAFEPDMSWSLANLRADHGEAGLASFRAHYPELRSRAYPADADPAALADELVEDADLVVVHEWNEPALVAAIGRARRRAHFTVLFHDTHHRAVSDPEAIRRFDLADYDGVLAFGRTLADIYRAWGWGERVFVWHEAADTRLFRPPPPEDAPPRDGLVWIGNWGDDERSGELETFLFRPAAEAGLSLDVHGVRYPEQARAILARHGVRYRGWLANAAAPAVYARHLATVHVPRRPYAAMLPGIPTIRVFEALACGIPLVSAPWEDSENLFTPGEDFLFVRDGAEAARTLRAIAHEPALRARLAAHGLETVRARHTCAHRAAELLALTSELAVAAEQGA